MKTIQEELGGGVSSGEEIEEMKTRAKSKKWDERVKKHFNKELSKMQRMNPQVADSCHSEPYFEYRF